MISVARKIKSPQAEIAALFGKSQPWVSNMQRLRGMPRDLAGARRWGVANNLLAAPPAYAAPMASPGPMAETPLLDTPPDAPSPMESADLSLKKKREAQIDLDIAIKRGDYIARRDVEAREITAAAEFRRIAIGFPARVRQVLDRHVATDLADAIMLDLRGIAAELLNRADPRALLATTPRDQLRAALLDQVEALLA